MLSTSLQANMFQIRRIGNNRTQEIPEHFTVDFAVLGISPSDIEDVGNVCELREFGLRLLGIGDVALDVLNRVVGVPGGARAASDAVDLPWATGGVGEREDLGEAVADDAGDADD